MNRRLAPCRSAVLIFPVAVPNEATNFRPPSHSRQPSFLISLPILSPRRWNLNVRLRQNFVDVMRLMGRRNELDRSLEYRPSIRTRIFNCRFGLFTNKFMEREMRFTIAIAMLAMLASSVCAQSGSSVTAPAMEAPVYGGEVMGDVSGAVSNPSSVISGETIQSAPMYSDSTPMYTESAPMASSGQIMSAPVASSDCGCSGGAAPMASAPTIVSAPVQSYAPAASPCGCGSPCPPAPVADPCCPQQRRGFFRNLFGN